jgi:anti-sigma28 factor (negative regulator of flagellin synthesis)
MWKFIRDKVVFNYANGLVGSVIEVNKIGLNPTHPLSGNRNAKNSVVLNLTGQRRRVAKPTMAPTSKKPEHSAETIDVNALESRINQLPDIDAARIVELHNRIMACEYEFNSQSLADKLIGLESILDP